MVTDDGVTGSIVVPRSISGRLERHDYRSRTGGLV
jgi:hypothetical protein